MLVNCFLPAVVDITPAWMKDDYSKVNDKTSQELTGAASNSRGAAEAAAVASGAAAPSAISSESPGGETPDAGTETNNATATETGNETDPETDTETEAASTPTSAPPIGSFYDPYGEDDESLAWKPIVDQTLKNLQTQSIPQPTCEQASSPELVNAIRLQHDRRTVVFDSFQKINHEELIMVLSNAELTEKFKTEIKNHPNFTPAYGNPAFEEDETTRLRNALAMFLPNGKAASELQQHVVKEINTQIKDHCAPNSRYQAYALDLRNSIKGNIQHTFNANFVKLLTGRGGIEKVNESLKKALFGYAADLSE